MVWKGFPGPWMTRCNHRPLFLEHSIKKKGDGAPGRARWSSCISIYRVGGKHLARGHCPKKWPLINSMSSPCPNSSGLAPGLEIWSRRGILAKNAGSWLSHDLDQGLKIVLQGACVWGWAGQQSGNGGHYQLQPRASLFSLVMDNQSRASIAGGRIIRAVLLRGELIRGDLQLPTVIPGDLWWAVGSGFNTKWAVSFLDKEQPRILIKNEIY